MKTPMRGWVGKAVMIMAALALVPAAPRLCSGQAAAQGGAENAIAPQRAVDAVFAAYDKPDSPGCAVGVVRDAKFLYARGYGLANLEYGIPLSAQSVLDIGSTSKQFTAASILLLQQQGKLSLDDDIRKFVPEIPAYQKPVTIRHLLHHTSGLRDYLTLMSLAGTNFDSVTTDDDALNLIVRQKALNFTPGDEFLYSNSGYFLLSVIVKRASGKSLRAFAAENIFGPLGMKSTHYHDDHTQIVPNRATAYGPGEKSGFVIDMSGFEQTGDGAVYTTVEDLLQWDQNFYQPKVGGPELIEQLQTMGALNNGEKIVYARGLNVTTYKGLKKVSHGGSWAGYRAELLRFPQIKFSVICLCNLGGTNPSSLAQKVADVYLAAEYAKDEPRAGASAGASSAPATVTLSEEALKQKAGLYRSSSGAVRRVTLQDGKLWIDTVVGPRRELAPLAADCFRIPAADPAPEILFSTAQGKMQLRLERQGQPAEIFVAVEVASPTPAQLTAFAGTYYSEELDTTYRLSVDKEKLSVSQKGQTARALTPTTRDAFIGPGGVTFEFQRDAQGRVSGFLVQAGRIRGVGFARRP
jgi:CubicO group peptidase (beta-lactamase class C family)